MTKKWKIKAPKTSSTPVSMEECQFTWNLGESFENDNNLSAVQQSSFPDLAQTPSFKREFYHTRTSFASPPLKRQKSYDKGLIYRRFETDQNIGTDAASPPSLPPSQTTFPPISPLVRSISADSPPSRISFNQSEKEMGFTNVKIDGILPQVEKEDALFNSLTSRFHRFKEEIDADNLNNSEIVTVSKFRD